MRAVFSILFFAIAANALACGTLESRYNFYRQANDDRARFTHLRYLICNPIVDDYKDTQAERYMIVDLVEDAQKRSAELYKDTLQLDAKWKAEYYRNLAIRLIIRFKMSQWDVKFKDEIIWSFDPLFGVSHGKIYKSLHNLDTHTWLSTDKGLSLSEMEYSSKLNFEVLELIIAKP
ncbi:MAG: hypothetical protein ACPGLV_02845 [Bacteroidia bacterium]